MRRPDGEHFVITIRPAPSEGGLLRVSDAMQQVLDALKIFEEAQAAVVPAQEAFDWRLEKASTNSPLTVVATAVGRNPNVNISAQARRTKSEVSKGLRLLIERREKPWWMTTQGIDTAQKVFNRTLNGIATTEIEIATDDAISIDRVNAEAGIRAIDAINAVHLVADLDEREAFGEVNGLMVAAGRYWNKPAIQIRVEPYGTVWCVLSNAVISRFGTSHSMAEVWEGRTIGVEGRLHYAKGGRLSKISVTNIREIPSVATIDLDSVLDPDFTAGLDPVEYLEQLHEGKLA